MQAFFYFNRGRLMSDQKEVVIKDLHLGNASRIVAHMMKQPGCIVIVRDEHGVVSTSSHGVNHAVANEMLSIGIYSNLAQHYEAIRDGQAGAEAKEMQQEIDHRNNQGESA